MSSTILITGATGNVGASVLDQLATHGNVRAAVRKPSSALRDEYSKIDYVRFDFTDASTFMGAFAGVDRLFLVRPPQLGNVEQDIVPALEAAREAGVQHVVFLSLMGVENQRFTPHYKIEAWLRESGLDWTFLRAGFFMQNLDTTHREEIRDEDKIAVPVGKAKTSFIDVRDIARVGVRALTEDGFIGRCPTLTGSEALTYYQVAEVLSDVLGRRITYTDPNPIAFFMDRVRRGQSWAQSGIMTFLYTITRFGNAADVNPDMPTLLGRAPISFRQYAEDYRDAWLRQD